MPVAPSAFSRFESVIKFALLALGLLPTAAVLTGIIDIPPSLKQLLSLVSGVVGVGTVVIVLVLQDVLQRLDRRRLSMVLAGCLVIGCAMAFLYYDFAGKHVAKYRGETIVLPLHEPAALHNIVQDGYGGDFEAALNSPNRGRYVYQLVEANNGVSTFLFVVLLMVSQFLIVFGLFGAVVRVALSQAEEVSPAPAPAPAPPPTPAGDPVI